jgi:uncharacterized protein YqeY
MNLKKRINSDFMIAYKAKDMNKKTFLGILKERFKKPKENKSYRLTIMYY